MIAITTKYVPATNTRCARIVATTENGHKLSVSVGTLDNTEGLCDKTAEEKHVYVATKLFNEQMDRSDKYELSPAGGIKGGYAFVIVPKSELKEALKSIYDEAQHALHTEAFDKLEVLHENMQTIYHTAGEVLK